MIRRHRCEIVEGLIYASGKAGRCDVVAEDSAVGDLSKETGLRSEFIQQVRDVLLPLGRKSFLVSRAAAECDDNDLALTLRTFSVNKRACAGDSGTKRRARRRTQEVTSAQAQGSRYFRGT